VLASALNEEESCGTWIPVQRWGATSLRFHSEAVALSSREQGSPGIICLVTSRCPRASLVQKDRTPLLERVSRPERGKAGVLHCRQAKADVPYPEAQRKNFRRLAELQDYENLFRPAGLFLGDLGDLPVLNCRGLRRFSKDLPLFRSKEKIRLSIE